MKSYSESYKDAGVDVTAGYKAVELMKQHVARTMTKGVVSGIGGFGGLFELDCTNLKKPVLVSGTDGVGTKLKLAFRLNKHDTVGIDCVAMCVNDIICCGAKPLVFLDYIACGKNIPEKIAEIVSGVAEGCVQSGAALSGGETAEMPGFYPEDEYDLAGFSVGVVDKDNILDQTAEQPGDVLIGLPSSGVHSNGFSLVRKVFDMEHADLSKRFDTLDKSLGETQMCIRDRSYLSQVSITWSSRMEPPGWAMYRTPERFARSMLSPKGKNASEPSETPDRVSSQAFFSSWEKGTGFSVKNSSHFPSANTSIESSDR